MQTSILCLASVPAAAARGWPFPTAMGGRGGTSSGTGAMCAEAHSRVRAHFHSLLSR